MSVLSDKTIRDFAKVVNTAASTKNNDYSMAGTVKEILEEDLLNGGGTITKQYVAKVLLDGGNEDNLCTATYNGIVCSVGDRVAVTIQGNLATVTENYTNPNGNTIYTSESGLQEFHFENNGSRARAVVTFNLPILDGYYITGIKGIDLWVYVERPEQYGGNAWVSISSTENEETENLAIVFASRIHLTSFNMAGNTITLTFGSNRAESAQYKVNVTYICVNSKELRLQ